MYCVKCGKELPTNALFCNRCGTKVETDQEKKPTAFTISSDQREEYSKNIAPTSVKRYSTFGEGVLLKWIAIAVTACVVLLLIYSTVGNSKFSIEGKWKSVGDSGFGQAQPGAIVAFDGQYCNLFSPQDTYALRDGEDGNHYYLDISGFMGTGNMTFEVYFINKDNVQLSLGRSVIELQRMK